MLTLVIDVLALAGIAGIFWLYIGFDKRIVELDDLRIKAELQSENGLSSLAREFAGLKAATESRIAEQNANIAAFMMTTRPEPKAPKRERESDPGSRWTSSQIRAQQGANYVLPEEMRSAD
jgi:hypothetical protein